MKLSVIIVNYNVKYFLEQCLFSVREAIKGIDAEVFIVDNNSVDGSCGMLREKFSEFTLIENRDNKGFSKANNQAIRIAKGDYVLLLNPDTIVEEDTFSKVIDFMDSHPDAGGLGVKMIDGKGNFLPESKRGLPTPMVAFYKIFGLSKIFPKSKTFGKYHLGYLDNNEIHEIDVLSGAFMLLRKVTIDKVGMLDEDYFMYGEDIDLSYRITIGGYKNYYYPDTTIIHYKGESTKKGSINYVRVFYNAMIIFARKHFSKRNAGFFSFCINLAIYFRALLSLTSRFAKSFFLPFIDALLIFGGYYFVKPYWEIYKFPDGGTYPDEFLLYAVPSYILIWLLSVFFNGGYERPFKILKLLRGVALGTLTILIVYALLSEDMRFSRALILIGALWTFISLVVIRLFLHVIKFNGFRFAVKRKNRVVIVGLQEEAKRVSVVLNKTELQPNIIGLVNPLNSTNLKNFIGGIDNIEEIVRINKIDEIIFCSKDIPANQIIKNMLQLEAVNVDYKIASPDSISIIGSNSIHTSGEFYSINLNSISKGTNKRNKRFLDIVVSLLLLVFLPIFIFIVDNKSGFIKNILHVLFGFKSWVGYFIGKNINILKLPVIKKGVLSLFDMHKDKEYSCQLVEKLNMLYAKDYKIINDLFILAKSIKDLGR